jgi:hypothetical protein
MRTLDRLKPHGIVTPTHKGIAFTQAGINFDSQGDELSSPASSVVEPEDFPPPASAADPSLEKLPANASWPAMRKFASQFGGPTDTKENILTWLQASGRLEQ